MAERWIGRSLRRPDAYAKLTGEMRYASEHAVPGMLVGRALRSDVARARIHRLDLGRARAVPGVIAALGPGDLGSPVPRYGALRADQPVLADTEVRFHGEAIAAVAAIDAAAAQEALDAIVVELEELPAVVTLDDALRPGAPPASPDGVVLHESRFAWGELPRDAATVLEREYEAPAAQHVSMEPHACVAEWDSGGLTVWAGSQHPFHLRRILGEAFGLPLSRIRVIALPMGGAFGGKGYPKLEPICAVLSRAAGRPVGMRATLSESFHLARGAGARVAIRTALGHDGRVRSQEVRADFLAGAYADMAPRVVEKSTYLACGPYRTPAARIVGRAISSNTTPSTAFRGFGAPQMAWALESQMDELARLIGEDPLEFRLRNLCARGESVLPGETPCDGDWRAALVRAADAVGYGGARPSGRGAGLAIAIKAPTAGSTSVAIVRLHPDASATVQVGTTELGQGSRIAMAQIAAEALGVDVDVVSVPHPDTALTGFDLATASSRSTTLAGRAVLSACEDVLRQLEELGESALGGPARVDAAGGCVVSADGRRMRYPELFAAVFGAGHGEIVGRGTYRGEFGDLPLGGPAPFWEVCAAASEVAVDVDTGALQVLRQAVASDVGRAINPAAAEGQDLGGAVMGLGQTLGEELRHDERGRLLNADLEGYRIPAAKDVPAALESILIENADGPGPFGAKGIGESGIMAVAASVGNALFDATGLRVRRLPLTAERIWRAAHEHAHTTPPGAMTMTLNLEERTAAEAIGRAREDRLAMPARGKEVSLEAGYRIQAARENGRRVVGYKLGLVSPAKQRQIGIASPLCGRVYDDMLSTDLDVDLDEHIQPRVEPELVARLAADVTPGSSAEDARSAIGELRVGLDLLDTVWEGYRFAPGQIVADNLAEGAVFVGEPVDAPAGSLTLLLDGRVVTEGPVEDLGDPGERLSWLAGMVGGLRAGDVVFLGSPAPAVDARAGEIEVRGPGGARLTGVLKSGSAVPS